MESQIGAFKENEELTHLEPLVDADAGDHMDNQIAAFSKIEELINLEPLAKAEAVDNLNKYDPVYS